MGEPAEWLAVKPHFGGRSRRLYSDRRHQLKMFSPTCNFFVPFAQKDARFAFGSEPPGGPSLPSAQKISREIKG